MEYLNLAVWLWNLPWVLLTYLAAVLTWVLYLAAMGLIPHLKSMGWIVKIHAYAVVLVGVIMDFLLHMVIGTILFMDLPREWLLTGRLRRYHGSEYIGSKRAKIAEWICTHLLDPFDPDGDHC